MTLQQFFDEVYRPLRLRGRSQNTSRLYGCTIRSFGRFLGRVPQLHDVADEMALARFLEHRQATRSPYSAEKERSQLMSLARLANERRMIAALPACQPCLLPDRTASAWTEDELHRLFAAAEATRGMVGAVSAGEWWAALLLCGWETTERVGAMLEVEPGHLRRPFLEVPGEIRKGGRRARVYELSDSLCDRLARLARVNRGRLFAWPHPRTYIWDRLKDDILARAGLAGKRLAFQQVRRSAISHMARAAGDAAAIAFAGHVQPATTRRWYLDPRFVPRPQRPADVLPRMDRPANSH
jgi:integrase